MQELEKSSGDDAVAMATPPRRQRNRRVRPWQEVVSEYQASGLAIEAYCERSGISRASMTRYLVLARQAGRSSGMEQAMNATGAVAQAMSGFVRVGIVDRAVNATCNGTACDVPELLLGDGVRLRLPAYALEPVLQAMIARIGGGAQ
ncbi:hypothetical protein AWB78_08522 [Caballeronia calidae]|uniref:Uncharacterized protein n=1 Tax=Caballeronia calidae TaxID=1777139 RepID=A0A158EKA7_9BURK|nr:hypothetical protein [Caballeronia calidae]SAL07298.1 hypothetical protein AWB78_08522 [Caballeronia calidae]